MIPADDRSPFRNQRWVECQGSQIAFGDCMKITDSTRVAEEGIRTVFQVATPDKDSQPNTIIIGHMEGSQGYCTNDFPTYAKCDQTAVPGDEVGPVAGSRTLAKGYRGYLVMGDVQGGMARVRRLDGSAGGIVFKLLTDRTREVFEGKAFGRANATVQAVYGDVPVAVGATVEVRFADRLWLGAVKGCEGIADYYGSPIPYVVKDCQELSLTINGIITRNRATHTPDDDVPFTLVSYHGAANAVYPPLEWLTDKQAVKVRYPALKWPRALEGAGFTAVLDVDYNNTASNSGMHYRVVESDQQTTRILFDHPAFCPHTSFTPSDVKAMNFHPFSQEPDGQNLLVFDLHGLASMGGQGQAEWDETSESWIVVIAQLEELYMLMPGPEADCPVILKQKVSIGRCVQPEVYLEFEEFDAVLSVEAGWDGCDIQLDYNYTNFCALRSPFAPREADEDTITFGSTNALSDVELVFTEEESGSGSGDCNPELKLNYKTTPALTCPNAQESALQNASLVPITQETVVVEIDMAGCPTWTTSIIYVLGNCGSDAPHEADCEQCPESGSGA